MARRFYEKIGANFFVFASCSVLWAQQKFALVIGNGNYTNISKLNNPVNDANDIATTLQGLGFTVDKMLTEAQDTSSTSGKARTCYIAGGLIGAVGAGILLYMVATSNGNYTLLYSGLGAVAVGGVVALLGLMF